MNASIGELWTIVSGLVIGGWAVFQWLNSKREKELDKCGAEEQSRIDKIYAHIQTITSSVEENQRSLSSFQLEISKEILKMVPRTECNQKISRLEHLIERVEDKNDHKKQN